MKRKGKRNVFIRTVLPAVALYHSSLHAAIIAGKVQLYDNGFASFDSPWYHTTPDITFLSNGAVMRFHPLPPPPPPPSLPLVCDVICQHKSDLVEYAQLEGVKVSKGGNGWGATSQPAARLYSQAANAEGGIQTSSGDPPIELHIRPTRVPVRIVYSVTSSNWSTHASAQRWQRQLATDFGGVPPSGSLY